MTFAIFLFTRATSTRNALLSGLVMGAAWYGFTLKWLYAGVDRSGHALLGISAPTAAIATMTLLPIGMSLAAHHSHDRNLAIWLLLTPTTAFAFEYLRHIGPMPFPWPSLGLTQVPDGLFAGALPWVGVIGLAWLMPFCACLLLALLRSGRYRLAVMACLCVAAAGSWLSQLELTHDTPSALQVSLVQGNVLASTTAAPSHAAAVVDRYLTLVQRTRHPLVVLPESAWPVFGHQLPGSLMNLLTGQLTAAGQDLITGHLMRDSMNGRGYHNVAHALGVSGEQVYVKRILVPFGEYIPFDAWLRPWYRQISKVDLLATTPGSEVQPPLIAGGHRAAIRLCFEDLFGHHFLDDIRHATLLISMTHDDWFESSQPSQQHLQIAQARAMEARKPVLRVGNTNGTALIDHFGHIVRLSAPDIETLVEGQIQPRSGDTPFTRHGLLSPLLMILLISALCLAIAPGEAPGHTGLDSHG